MRNLYLGVLALLLISTPGTAQAQRGIDGGGWPMWEHRANGLIKAMEDADVRLLDVHCDQLGRVLTRSGIRFPAWANALSLGCAAVRNVFEPINDQRRYRIVCRDLRRAEKELGKAREVPEAPNADNLARQLSSMIGAFRKEAC